MRKSLAGLLALAFLAGLPAHATNAPPSPPATSILSGQVALSVSSTSSRVALPSTAAAAGAITVYNKGATDTYVALGSSSIVATSGGTCIVGVAGPSCLIAAGTSITFWNVGSATYIAGITASSTSTLIIYQGTGPLGMRVSGSSGGGGSGTVTEVDTGTGLTGGPITTSGTVALKPAAAGEIGGVNSSAAVTHNFLTAISTAGVISKAQPACADISDAGTGCSGAASATGANPTATIGASAVNGSAATFMRSDAAPALPATLPALNGSLLTALNGANITAGSVANAALANSATIINGTSIALGASGTITAAAGTLTGGMLASGVLASSLTSVGTLTGGATGTGFTVALTTSTVTGTLADARLSTNVPLKNAANVFTSMQVFNRNTAGAPTPITGAVVQIVGADAANGFVENDTFGATPIFTGRRADGTGASPTAVQSAEALAGFSARPYDGTGYTSASTGNVQAVASEPFSGTNHGTDLVGNCTAITTVTTAECWRAKSGGFTIPTGSTYQINGAQIAASNLSNGVSGSGAICLVTNCAMTTPNLGTPSAAVLTNATSIPAGQLTGSIADARLSANVPLLNASNTFTAAQTANSFIPSSSTVPTNGIYLGAANTVSIAASSARVFAFATAGMTANSGTGPEVIATASNCTSGPAFVPVRTNVNTGFSGDGTNLCASITGVQIIQLSSTGLTDIGRFTIGSLTPATGQAGDLALVKETDAAAAPGAGFCVLKTVAGTNSGSGKVLLYCGTSTTPVTIADNAGGGF